jgi:hypothetical protein
LVHFSARPFVPSLKHRGPSGTEFLLYEIYSVELRSNHHYYRLKFNNDPMYQHTAKWISDCCSVLKTIISFLCCTRSVDWFPPVVVIGNDINALATLKDHLLELEKIIDGNSFLEKEDIVGKECLEKSTGSIKITNFNVMGDIVSVPKSTIDKYLPDSQLAVRVSGRWEAQPGEIDSQGNLIIMQPKEPMMNCFPIFA